jgi:hypothetical protein
MISCFLVRNQRSCLGESGEILSGGAALRESGACEVKARRGWTHQRAQNSKVNKSE